MKAGLRRMVDETTVSGRGGSKGHEEEERDVGTKASE